MKVCLISSCCLCVLHILCVFKVCLIFCAWWWCVTYFCVWWSCVQSLVCDDDVSDLLVCYIFCVCQKLYVCYWCIVWVVYVSHCLCLCACWWCIYVLLWRFVCLFLMRQQPLANTLSWKALFAGQELGDSRDKQGKGGPVPTNHATRLRPQEQCHETTPLGPDTGIHGNRCLLFVLI